MKMLCNTPKGTAAGCHYGNGCCASMLHASGHKRKRRAIKRSERQDWKREVRAA